MSLHILPAPHAALDTHGVSLHILPASHTALDTHGVSLQARTRVETRHACPT